MYSHGTITSTLPSFFWSVSSPFHSRCRRATATSEAAFRTKKWFVVACWPCVPLTLPLGEPALIHPFLAEISKERRGSLDGDLNTGAAALHLAIRCASG